MKEDSLSSQHLKKLYEGDDYTSRCHSDASERIGRLLPFMNLSPKDRVLDLGCGNGITLPALPEIGYYEGIDFSSRFIAEANTRAEEAGIARPKYKYVCGDITKAYENYKGTFDEIISFDFTEHINDDELRNIFAVAKRLLSENGNLYIHTPNKDFIVERLKSERHKVEVQGHIALRNAREYRDLFKDLGFSRVEVIPLAHYIGKLKPLHTLSRLPNAKVASLFQARLLVICSK